MGNAISYAFGLAAIVSAASACGGRAGGRDAGGRDADVPPCSPDVGLVAPLPECTVDDPCTRIAPELPQAPIVSASDPPSCADARWDETWTTTLGGTTRYACVFRAAGASPSSRRPLVIWFHPGGEGADNGETETHLLDKAETFDLASDASRLGYTLVVPQGRNLHWPPLAPRDGRHHDFYHRDLASPSGNPDVAFADAIIDAIVAEGIVDPERIHVMGWSNGGFFGQLYAIARHVTRTPGGSRIASAAVFATGDPFENIRWDPFAHVPYGGSPSCRLATYPASDVPILLVRRTCDAATPCGTSDDACFVGEPGHATGTWLAAAAAAGITGITNLTIRGLELGAAGTDQVASGCSDVASACDTASCSERPNSVGCLCLVNHLRWPDGDYANGVGVDQEPTMLGFLRDHPLAP